MASFLTVVRSIALLLARVGLGGVLILHGVMRWNVNGGPTAGIGQTVQYLTPFGVPYVEIAAWSIISIEIIGGILLVAGAFTPLVAALIIAEQGFLIAWTNYAYGPSLFNEDGTLHGGWEYNAVIIALALLFLVFGAGRVAVDALFGRKKNKATEDEFDAGTSTTSSFSSRDRVPANA